MANLLQDDTDVEVTRYNEAANIKRYSGVNVSNVKNGIIEHDPVKNAENVYINLPSGGRLLVGSRPVTPKEAAQTDMLAQTQQDMIAPDPAAVSMSPIEANGRAPIEDIIGAGNGPVMEDYLAAGYTEQEVMQFQDWNASQLEQQMIARGDQFPNTLTPEQLDQLSQIPGAAMVQPREASFRDNVQSVLYNAMDPNKESSGPIADAIGTALRSITGGQDMDPGDLRFWSNYLTDLVDLMVPGVGGAISTDEGARMFNYGFSQVANGNPSGVIDMAVGGLFTTLGVAEFVPYVKSLTGPAKDMLRQASPAVRNAIADTIGASKAISRGDMELLNEIFQPSGTPTDLGAAANIGRDILQINLNSNEGLAKMFDDAGVTLDSSVADISKVLRRAADAGNIDPRTAETTINGLRD